MAKPYFSSNHSLYQSPVCENAVCIPVTKGVHTIISTEDFEQVAARRWKCWTKKGYSAVCESKANGGALHRLIMNPTDGLWVDHINHDTLDNRRSNLRLCNKKQSGHNTRARKGSSRYKGVSKYGNSWRVTIRDNGKVKEIGRYADEHEAARHYNEAAKKYYGEFAYLNEVIS